MRLALISDIHGNLVSLNAVLADIKKAQVDEIICLGDVVNLGPQPKEVISTLKSLGCRCVQGNHDLFVINPQTVHSYTQDEWFIKLLTWSISQLSEDDINKGPIAIPGEHTTAHMLFRLRYPDASNKQFVMFSDVEQAVLDGKVVAGVIIHENRFTYRDKGLVKIIDLGDFWEDETSTPIPLGAIVAKRSLGPAVIERFDKALAASVSYAFENPSASVDYVRRYASEMDHDVMRKHIETYVNEFSIHLGEIGTSAIHQLETRASEAGIL